jgi:ribosome-associated protein
MSLDVTVRGITLPAEELSWRFSRSTGPGGQSVNTTDSRAELSFDLAGSAALPPVYKERALRALAGGLSDGILTVTAAETRSQLRNREAAAERMSALLTEATAAPPRPRRPTRPSRAARERRLAAKKHTSQIKRLRRSRGDD